MKPTARSIMGLFNWSIGPLAVLLIIAGFIVPPIGVIDGSVLTAVGLLLGFKAIDTFPSLIRDRGHGKLQVGNTSIEVKSNNTDNTDNL